MIPQIKEINFPSYATLHEATVSLQEMGERTITTQVRIDGDIVPSFDGWELEFKGERFILPTKEPQAAKDNTTRNSLVDLTFVSWPVEELKRYFFFDTVTTAAGTVMADKYKVPVNLNLPSFVQLFNRVLNYYFNGEITMQLSPSATYATEPTLFEIDYTYLWDVLVKIFEMYKNRWTIEYNAVNQRYIIKVGYAAESITDHDFEYGYKGGLLRFERQVQDPDITNILLGRGGEKNLPYRYFKDTDPNNPEWAADPHFVPELANVTFERIRDINFRWYVRGWRTNEHGILGAIDTYDPALAAEHFAYAKGHTDEAFDPVEYVKDDESIAKYGEHWGALDDNDEIYPTIQGVTRDPMGRVDEVVAVSDIITDDIDAMAKNAAVENNIDGQRSITKSVPGNGTDTNTFTGEPFTVPTGKTANLSLTGDTPYFAMLTTPNSAQQALIGIRSSVIKVQDVATGTLYDFGVGIPAGTYRYVITITAYNNNAYAMEVTYGFNGVKMVTADENENAWKPTFDIWIKNIWETTQNPGESDSDYALRVWRPILGDRLGNEAKVVFSDGFMSISEDYEFVIASYPVVDRTRMTSGDVPSEWKITLYKSSAEYDATGLYIPNATSGGKPVAGDHFYFIGIDMPFIYVQWAEERLNEYKTNNLDGTADIAPTWIINLDKVRVHTLEDEEYGSTLADRLAAGANVRIKDKRFTPGKVLTLYVQTITYTWKEPTKENPYIVPDIEVVLSDKVVATEGAIKKLQNDVNVVRSTYAKTSDIEQVVRRVATPLFLKKTGEADTSDSPTTFASKVASKAFRQGDVGGQGWGIYEDGNGKSVYEVDKLVVRDEMRVNSLVAHQISYIGGMRIESAASIECTQMIDTEAGYVCYFDQKRGSVANLFVIGDFAYGHVFNKQEATVRYYKREVLAVGTNYITLAKVDTPWDVIIDEEEGIVETRHTVDGSGIPAKGDTIIQFGHRTESSRQYVIITDVIGGGYQRMLADLNHAAATGREYYFAGRQASTGDRWFVGDKEAGKYAEWKDGELTISGRLSVNSQVAKEDGSYVGLTEYLNQLQNQVDGNVQNWFEEGVPSPLAEEPTATPNYPASTWPTVTDKNKHLGDLYYNTLTGKGYRYELVSGNYVWGIITDEEISKALRDAAEALAAAEAAQEDADAANNRLNAWSADGVISPTEKQSIKDEIKRIDSDYQNINASYTLYGLDTPTAYNSAYTAYRAQLVSLSADSPETIEIPASFAGNQIAYYTQRTACLNAIESTIKSGLTNLGNEIAGYQYLKEALGQSTLIQGGLILTSLIQLGKTENGVFNVYSGINGIMDTNAKGNGIASWYGGPMGDKEDGAASWAKSLFRFDGSGYLASGNIHWNPDGTGSVPGLTWDGQNVIIANDVKFQSATGSELVGLIETVRNFVDWFEEVNLGTEQNPAWAIRLKKRGGTLDRSFVTYGDQIIISGTPGGEGPGGASYLHELLDVAISNPSDGQALVYRDGEWVNENISIDLSNYYTKAQVDSLISGIDLSGYVQTSRLEADEAKLSDAIQSLQSQIDAVSARNNFDELTATSFYADMMAATYAYAERYYLTDDVYFSIEKVNGTACVRLNAPFITDGDQIIISGTPGSGGGGSGVTLYDYTQVKAMTADVALTAPSAWAMHQMWAEIFGGASSVLTSGNYTNYVNTTNFPGLDKIGTVTSVATGTGLTGGTITSAGVISIDPTYLGYITHGETAYGWGDILTRAIQSFQSQIDSVSARDTFDELTATALYADTGAISALYAGSIELGGEDLATAVSGIRGRLASVENKFDADGSALSAVRLKNTRTLWGQNFDGTANVVGDMTSVGSLTASGLIKTTNYAQAQRFYLTDSIYFYTETVDGVACVMLNAPFVTSGDQIIMSGTPGGGGHGVGYLYELEDVSDALASPTSGMVLFYNGTEWVGVAASSIGGVTSVVGQTGAVTTEQVANALTAAGYKLTDTIMTSLAWNAITNKPTTLSGYGITDAASASALAALTTRVGTLESGEAVVSAAIQSLQSQIDSVSARDEFDELTATVLFADTLSASDAYIDNITGSLSGNAATASRLVGASYNVGNVNKPVYFSGGLPVETTYAIYASLFNGTAGRLAYYNTANLVSDYTGNVGSATQPMHLVAGVPTACTYTLGAALLAATTAGKLAYYSGTNSVSSYTGNVGSGVIPMYLNAGAPTASTSTVGSAALPVYLNGGTITACSGASIFSQIGSNTVNNLELTIAGQLRTATLYATYDSAGENISDKLGIVGQAIQSLQSQVDSVSARNSFDELDATVGFIDTLSASVAYTEKGCVTGNLSVGQTSIATYPLYVVGVIASTGDQVVTSDATKKTNLKDIALSVGQIASAPAVTFDWKSGGHSFGSIAQYWRDVLPESVLGDEGDYSLAYAQLALVSAISLAKHETEQDREIRELKEKVARLENEVKRLRN